MAIFPGSAIPSAAADAYTIDNSLRFEDGDSAYLSRTPGSAGSARIFTISYWFKLSSPSGAFFKAWQTPMNDANALGAALYSGEFGMQTNNAATRLNTNQLFRDPGAWYHLCIAFDTNQATDTDRIKLYVNGSQVTSFRLETYPVRYFDYDSVKEGEFVIGADNDGSSYYGFLDSYMAEFYFIDGTQYDADDFGELDSTTNQWIPKDASGLTFGTNGFYQKYAGTELADSFTDSSASWIAPAGITSVDYLVVAGGGSGGSSHGGSGVGGGGAGGMLTGTLTVVPGTAYTVTVGAGGAAVKNATANDGADSVFASITATGGGGGGVDIGNTNVDGGSGGGGGNGGTGGSGVAGQGNDGGDSQAAKGGGGGGGKGAVGADNSDTTGGNGGAGEASSITGASVTYAGGGGASGGTGSDGSGGSGGGGAGNKGGDATAGTANTGGGGGGTRAAYTSGAGGSGIVVLNDGTTVTSFTSSHSAHTITAVGDVTQTRAVKKVGDSSIYFDGVGDSLTIPNSTDWDWGSGDFTMEAWIYALSLPTSSRGTIINRSAGTADNYWNFRIENTQLDFFVHSSGSYSYTLSTASDIISLDQWHHVAVVKDGNDYELFVDGTSRASDTETVSWPSISRVLRIGAAERTSVEDYFDGYMDEIRISDSARYTEDFAPVPTTEFTTDSNTLLLIHSNWDGGLGLDSSGEGNNFTPTNLVATDQMIDTPTNNFCTWNPIYYSGESGGSALSEGNLKWASSSGDALMKSTSGPITGKWYWEFYVNSISGTNAYFGASEPGPAGYGNAFYYSSSAGKIQSTGETTQTGIATVTAGDIVGIAIDLDASPQTGKVYKNNSQLGVTINLIANKEWGPFTGNANTSGAKTLTLNCGQDSSFAGATTAQGNQDGNEVGDFYYTPPTDYLALCTDNLSAELDITLPGGYFNTILYDDGAGAKTGVGFQPDLVWVKSRGSAYEHELTDSVRGVTKALSADSNNVESTDSTGLTAFGADGFTVGADTNYCDTTGSGMVAWNWKAGGAPTADNSAGVGATPTAGSVKIDGSNLGSALAGSIAATRISANTTSGFSIVLFTNNNTAGATVAHGLSSTPEMIITKLKDNTYSWYTYHVGVDATAPEDYAIELNTTGGRADSDEYWNDAAPSPSVFTLGDEGSNVLGSVPVIAYCFHSVEGYSKMGSFDGNGDTGGDGPFISTSFSPAYVLIKRTDDSGSWAILNNKSPGYNVVNNSLYASDSNAETTGADVTSSIVDFLSNGIKIRGYSSNVNNSSGTYSYLAFAESPFKYATAR